MTEHLSWCQKKAQAHTDAAKRMSDAYNLHRVAVGIDAVNKWIAVKLEDGSSDNMLYDDKLSAVKGQKHNEKYFAFIKIAPVGMHVCEAEVMLATHRRMYDAGMRMTDPDHKHGGPDLITRLTVSDQLAQMRGVVTGLRMPWEDN